MLSLADSCEPLPQLYGALSRESSSPSIITIDTPPPPAHSPYSSPRTALSIYDGPCAQPPPAHSHSSSSVSRGSHDRSWVVCRPAETMSALDSDHVPLSLTLRRCPVVDAPSASITLSSSSSSASPEFDALWLCLWCATDCQPWSQFWAVVTFTVQSLALSLSSLCWNRLSFISVFISWLTT